LSKGRKPYGFRQAAEPKDFIVFLRAFARRRRQSRDFFTPSPGTESAIDVLLDINGSGLLQEFVNCVKFMQPNCLPMNLIPGKRIEN